MRDFYLRLFFAALLSAAAALATKHFEKKFRIRSERDADAIPIAKLKSATNEVSRKPTDRLIWDQLPPEALLYSGEAIRTAGNAEAEIEFLTDGEEDGSLVFLENDSIIVLEENDGKINLDFQQGNLFIKASEKAENKLTLTAGEKKVELGKSELSVGKQANGQVDVEVVKGKVDVKDSKGQKVIDFAPKLKVLRPLRDIPIYLKPDSDDKTWVTWEPIDSSYEVSVEVGSARNKLAAIEGVNGVSGAQGNLRTSFPIGGKSYFRLAAKSSKPDRPILYSSTIPIEVIPKFPPNPIEPALDIYYKPQGEKTPVTFRWGNTAQLENIVVEIARSADMKKDYRKVTPTQGEILETEIIGKGEVYWRVTGYMRGTTQGLSCAVQKFFLDEKLPEVLLPPQLKSPAHDLHISYGEMAARGVPLTWFPSKFAKGYELTVNEINEKDEPNPEKMWDYQVVSPTTTMRGLVAGRYQWSVKAKGKENRVSELSEKRRFIIDPVSVLAWKDGKNSEVITYRAEKPKLAAEWEKGPTETVSWRVRMTNLRQPASDGSWQSVAHTKFESKIPGDGTYRLEVEALNAKKYVVAKSVVRTIEIKKADPLPPPPFADSMPPEILGKNDGTAEILWQPVDEAKEYVLTLRSSDDSVMREVKSQKTGSQLEELAPGQYKVSLKTIDPIGRIGAEGQRRVLKIPPKTDVAAPKLMKVEVK